MSAEGATPSGPMLKFSRENKRLILTMIALILGAIMLATYCGDDGGGQYRMF